MRVDQALAQIIESSNDGKLGAIASESARRNQSVVLAAQTQNASSGRSRKCSRAWGLAIESTFLTVRP